MEIPFVNPNDTVRYTMERINEKGFGIAFISDKEGHLLGVVTDGDIRRAILSGISLQSEISEIMNRNPVKGKTTWSREKLDEFLNSPEVKKKASIHRPLVVPLVDKNDKVKDFRIVFEKEMPQAVDESETLRRLQLPKKILILGGAGYIGSVLVRMLLERGYYIKVMDNLVYGDEGIKDLYDHPNFEFQMGDVTDIVNVVESLEDVDAIIDLAAIVGDPASRMKPKQTLQVNFFSTSVLVDVAKFLGISRFIFASTCSVYGYRQELCTETTKTNPLSLYAETKIMSEEAILNHDNKGFCPTILRFATVYGTSPRMRFDLVTNLLTAKAVIERKITVFGQGAQKRPFVHVRDVCKAIVKVIEAPANLVCREIFNVGSENQNISIRELAEIIGRIIPEAEIEMVDEKEDNRSYIVSFEKITRKLDFKPKETIDAAVHEIIDFIQSKEIQDYKAKKYSNYESLRED